MVLLFSGGERNTAPPAFPTTEMNASLSHDDRDPLLANARRYRPNPTQQEVLIHELKQRDRHYDAKAHMLKIHVAATANRYHSKRVDVDAHPFRGSADYAGDLLDSQVPEYQERAFQVLATIVSHQDQQSGSPTYGLWPYYLEESLDQMNKPDQNWADFIGVSLLESYLRHYETLPEDLREEMEDALLHASRAIQKRDVKPDYTNIAIMGTLVTYLTGHLLDKPGLQQYAAMRLQRFYDYTVALGGFAEYNSPTYTQVALDELCRLRQYVLDADAKRKVNYCYELGWEGLAAHFHAPSAQLAGPHSRSYSTLLKPDFYDFLYGASQGNIDYLGAQLPVQYYKLQHELPDGLADRFMALPQPRTETDTFGKEKNAVVAYTYLHPQYCLGTANRGTTWQQRRPWVAYWGTPQQPRYLQPKLLRNRGDFAAGNIFSTQDKNCVLTTLDLSTDGGDYHLNMDRSKTGVFQAKDLRLRFELGGADLFSKIAINDDRIEVRDGDVHVDLQLLHAFFDDAPVTRLEKGKDQQHCWVDLIIHQGSQKTFDLKKMQQAAFSWSARIYTDEDDTSVPTARATVKGERIQLQWDRLQLSAPLKPGTEEQLQRSFSVE